MPSSHRVQYGESLWRIAAARLGDGNRWVEIARLNHLNNPSLIVHGQVLRLPDGPIGQSTAGQTQPLDLNLPQCQGTDRVPGRAFFFVLADEVNPFRRKLVRKVVFPTGVNTASMVEQIMNPARYGFTPRDPASPVSIGRHVMGMTNSRYISTSGRPFGSSRFEGKSYWIDADKVQKSGAVIHEGRAIVDDLKRILAKTKKPELKQYIQDIIRKSEIIDREILVEGTIPAKAVKGVGAMAMTKGLQVISGVGLVVTAYDIGEAGRKSYETQSVKPIAAESVRQIGGWGAALAGAKIGGAAGAAVGLATGPGAVISAGVGAVLFGAAGYFGADWVADMIDAN